MKTIKATNLVLLEVLSPCDCAAHFFTRENGRKAGKKDFSIDCEKLGHTWDRVLKKLEKITAKFFWKPEITHK